MKKARLQANLTQECLAELIGAHWQTVNYIERGKNPCSVTKFARISQALYVNVFSDAGNVYRRVREYNPTRLFRSLGVGAAVISPLGPIGLDLGYGLDKTDINGRPKPGWQLHFRLGNFF